MIRLKSLSIPYTFALSKNSVRTTKTGLRYLSRETKKAQQDIVDALCDTSLQWISGPVYITITVEKTKLLVDAINVVDLVADAIKKGIGVDDAWFHLDGVYWKIVDKDPQIHIKIKQTCKSPQQLCLKCRKIVPERRHKCSAKRSQR